ncbi:hypothetical protein MKW92_005798, partial [Papaver armeniacum]
MIGAVFTIAYLLGGKDTVFGPKAFPKNLASLIMTCIPFLYRLLQSLQVGCKEKEPLQFVN